MKTLSAQELRSIEQFFQLKQPSLLKAMRQYLKSKYEKVIATNDYLVAVGDLPVALVAHLDTVFSQPPKRIFYDREKNVMWSPEGLGADDRAGVYSIVQILKAGYRPTVIFTTDEELGCKGADKLIKDLPASPVELKYIVQLDRRGSNDCVFYDCEVPEFEEYIESFGFVMNFGSFSDISEICPQWKVAGVNLSIGYYDEHSVGETLYIGQMHSTINKVINMLKNVKNAPTFVYKESPYAMQWSKYLHPREDDDFYGWDPSYGISKEEWASFMEPQSKCKDCGKWDYDYNLFPTKGENGETVFFCSDCLSKRNDIHWCSTCGEPFIDVSAKRGTITECKDCRGNVNGIKSNPSKN